METDFTRVYIFKWTRLIKCSKMDCESFCFVSKCRVSPRRY